MLVFLNMELKTSFKKSAAKYKETRIIKKIV